MIESTRGESRNCRARQRYKLNPGASECPREPERRAPARHEPVSFHRAEQVLGAPFSGQKFVPSQQKIFSCLAGRVHPTISPAMEFAIPLGKTA
jgi:hypothetical protein